MKADIKLLIQSGIPVMISGDPGIGKTQIISQIAEEEGWDKEILIASIREPSDFSGIPFVTNGKLDLAVPSWAKTFTEDKPGILFFDEITTCSPSIQAALLRIVCDRVVGDYKIPDSVYIVAAGNRLNVSGTNPLSHPLANRFVHYDAELNPQKWVVGIVSGFLSEKDHPISDNWKDNVPKYLSLISQFIRSNPAALFHMPEDESDEDLAFPSPRTWEYAASILAISEQCTATISQMLLAGVVGKGYAAQYMTWVKMHDLIDIQKLLDDPTTYQLPDSADVVELLVSAVVSYCSFKPETYAEAGKIIIKRIFDAGFKSVIVKYARGFVQSLQGHAKLEDFNYLLSIMKLL